MSVSVVFSYLDVNRFAEFSPVSYAKSDKRGNKIKDHSRRMKGREEASVTTFALVVTRVFVYSRRGQERGWWRRRRRAFAGSGSVRGWFVTGVHTRVHVHVRAYAFTRRVANDLCISLITSVHCTVLSGDHSFIRPTCALRYCQRQKHPRHAEQLPSPPPVPAAPKCINAPCVCNTPGSFRSAKPLRVAFSRETEDFSLLSRFSMKILHNFSHEI